MISFFSNHKDTAAIEALTGEPVEVIPHPYIRPEWTAEDVKEHCAEAIAKAVDAAKLIINGDYTLVSIIVTARYMSGKKTGFVAFEKIGDSETKKDKAGNITHKNILKPVNIRWI